MTNATSDLQWIALELDDLAVFLRTHGLEEPANQLDAVREALKQPHYTLSPEPEQVAI
jgi:hypothetical protein